MAKVDARSDEERNLTILGQKGETEGSPIYEINNVGRGRQKRERERKREVNILPRGMNNLRSFEFK